MIRRRGSFERIQGYLEGLEEGSREPAEEAPTKKRRRNDPKRTDRSALKYCRNNVIFLEPYLRDFPGKSFEIPDRRLAEKRLTYLIMGTLKPETPEKITYQYIIQNSEYSIESQSKNWRVWVWRQLVLLKVSGIWDPNQYPYHFSDFWDIFCERKRYFERVYFIVDANDMPIQSKEFRHYVKKNWYHLIQSKDFNLYIVESEAMKRAIWTSTFQQLGLSVKTRLFKNHNRVLTWMKSVGLAEQFTTENETRRNNMKPNEPIPEKLTLEWIKKHAQIKLVGDGFRWVLMSWRNVIVMQISNDWKPDEMDAWVNRLSGLPAMLSNKWDKIFLVFDLSRMKFKKEDAFRYLRSNWLEFLDREDMKVCIVEENKMRRLLLRSLYRIIGKLDKIKLFPDCDQALAWVYTNLIAHKQQD